MRPFLKALLASALLALAGPVAAEDSPLHAMTATYEAQIWSAVGRIDFGGRSFCTGAMISDRLVLTAAHCLFEPETGRRYAPDEIVFRAGWREGSAAAYRGARRAMEHPGYLETDDQAARVALDIALIELEQPVRLANVHPFLARGEVARGDDVGVVSYAFDRAENPSLQRLCHVLTRQDGVLVLTCDIDFGSSGAPVFVFDNGVPHIVSVISAKAEDADGRKVSLGPDLQGPLAELQARMATASGVFVRSPPAVRKITGDGGRTTTGAKFLRP